MFLISFFLLFLCLLFIYFGLLFCFFLSLNSLIESNFIFLDCSIDCGPMFFTMNLFSRDVIFLESFRVLKQPSELFSEVSFVICNS
jgi:hypothetical protein